MLIIILTLLFTLATLSLLLSLILAIKCRILDSKSMEGIIIPMNFIRRYCTVLSIVGLLLFICALVIGAITGLIPFLNR